MTAEVYDVNHFPAWKDKYNVMSVPCLMVNGRTLFGKKSLQQLVGLLEEV